MIPAELRKLHNLGEVLLNDMDKLAKARHEYVYRVQPEIRPTKDHARCLQEGRHERKQHNPGKIKIQIVAGIGYHVE
jgi:hypothetical protein